MTHEPHKQAGLPGPQHAAPETLQALSWLTARDGLVAGGQDPTAGRLSGHTLGSIPAGTTPRDPCVYEQVVEG